MVLGMLLAVPAVAFAADEILTDGDLVTAGDNLTRNLGTLDPGETFTADPTATPPVPASDVKFYLDCNGNSHLNSGETADLNVTATSKKDANGNTITGGSVAATSLSNFSGPTSWPADGSGGSACNTFANAEIGTSNVTIVAPKKAGSYTYTVTYSLNRDSGTASNELDIASAQDPSNTDSVTATFTFSVDNAAPVINSFQVSNTDDGTSATEGQTKTYTVSATDANEDSLTYDLVKDSGTANVTINPVTGSPGSFTVQFDTPGSLVLKASASDGTATTTQNKTVTVAAANQAPTVPGAPTASSNPNKGVFNLNWTASDDDGKPDPPAAVTYTLQHKDSNDANFSNVATSISGSSYSFTATSPEVEGTWTYQVKASDGSLESAFSSASSAIKVDKGAPSQPNANFSKPAEDTVGGWYKDSVTVSYNGSTDPALLDTSAGSGVASYTAAQLFNTSGTHNFSGTATDGAGNESVARTGQVKVDTNNPTFGACPTAGPFLYGSGSQSVGPISASDTGESGVSANSTLSGSVDTSTVGTKQVTFTALDNVGHSDTKQCSYKVLYDYSGVLQPINAGGDSIFKAGSTIPVKFELLNGSAGITDAMISLKYVKISNGIAGDETEAVTNVAATTGSLFRSSNGQYIYNWSTKGVSEGTYELRFVLPDGTVQGTATISLKR
jgi:nitrogen fixation protein FixH